MYIGLRIAVIIPALNEAISVEQVIMDIRNLSSSNILIVDEIVLCDNGSSDATSSIAEQAAGAKIVYQAIKGYGNACLTAMEAMKPFDIVLFINTDGAEIIEQSIKLLIVPLRIAHPYPLSPGGYGFKGNLIKLSRRVPNGLIKKDNTNHKKTSIIRNNRGFQVKQI